MTNITFFTLIISTPFVMTNQAPHIPNYGRGATFERVPPGSRRRPLTVREGMQRYVRKKPMSKRKMHKSVRRPLEHQQSENDVLPFDYIKDEADKTVQTVEIPEEVLALDEEKSVQQKPEGRRKRGRVVGGTDVLSEEEFPFYASLRNSAMPNCGATILDSKHILTAAHCEPYWKGKYDFLFDRFSIGSRKRSDEGEIHFVKKCVKHPKVVPYDEVQPPKKKSSLVGL